jgi:hypothetical protein
VGRIRDAIEVRDLDGGGETRGATGGRKGVTQGKLAMSQVELFRSGSARWNDTVFHRPERPYLPDPMAVLGPIDEVEAYYEVYNLAERGGELCYRVTQTIVPIAYRRAWESLHRAGRVDRSDSLAYGREGDRLGKVVLKESNRRSVTFPPTRIPARAAVADIAGRNTVRATARIAAAGLVPGGYAFRIEIEDCATGERMSAETYFRVVTSGDLTLLRRAPLREKRMPSPGPPVWIE